MTILRTPAQDTGRIGILCSSSPRIAAFAPRVSVVLLVLHYASTPRSLDDMRLIWSSNRRSTVNQGFEMKDTETM